MEEIYENELDFNSSRFEQAFSNLGKRCVANGMAVSVINLFEVVHINKADSNLSSIAVCIINFFFECKNCCLFCIKSGELV